jgi:hypothetical protein
VWSRVETKSLVVSNKLTAEQYPQIARPSMTRNVFEEFNSVSSRQGSGKQFKTGKLDINLELKMFYKNYFREDWEVMSAIFKKEPIVFDVQESMEWLSSHNYPEKVMLDVKKVLESGWEMQPINNILVHGKIEQTTKLDKQDRFLDQVVTRSILASTYCMSAVFGPIFKKVKQRFKEMLNDKTVYVDGMTPNQMSARFKKVNNVNNFVESDLTKQDAQTDHDHIDVEFEIYSTLGLDGQLLEMYKRCHSQWFWKGHGIYVRWDAMRLTGQPTTSLGNAITNLLVHNRLVARNNTRLELVAVLGDDNIMFANSHINVKMHGTETKSIYNMVCKVKQNSNVANFISFLVYSNDGIVCVCPHFKRLRHRYSVFNYTFSDSDRSFKVNERKTSYLLMLGANKTAVNILKEINPKISVQNWFDYGTAINANSMYDESGDMTIIDHINALLAMMQNDVIKRSALLASPQTKWN